MKYVVSGADNRLLVVFMCHTIKILISNWPRARKFSQPLQAGKTVAFDFSHHGHAMVTLYVQFLCSDWPKFDRWVHAENLCSILNLVYFDSWSWHSFVSTCDVFNCLFPLDVQNEIQLLSEVFLYSWLVCNVWSNTGLTWYLSGAASRMVLYLMFVFCIEFNEVERGLCGYLVYPRL